MCHRFEECFQLKLFLKVDLLTVFSSVQSIFFMFMNILHNSHSISCIRDVYVVYITFVYVVLY